MDNYIERLKAIPLTDILQNVYGIEIRQKGSRYYCKIRDEKTSSCCIYPNNNFYDFGGGVGGDTITLITLLDECDKKTAMQKLSELYNIEHSYNKRDRRVLMNYEWEKLGIVPDMVSKNLNINIIEDESQWSRNADINLNISNTEQMEMFIQRYHISVSEFRKKDPVAYHNLLRNKAYYPLLNEKDDYFAFLNSQYRFYEKITDKQTAFEAVITNPEIINKAKEIEAKFPLLRYAIDDKTAFNVPNVQLNPKNDLASILNGTAKFKISKISYFELCTYAKKYKENLCSITVSYSSYIDKRILPKSELRGIPHYSMYQNDECKIYFMAKDFEKMTRLFQGEIISKKQFSRPYAQENQTKNQSKSTKNYIV